jgi:hypothetical protein
VRARTLGPTRPGVVAGTEPVADEPEEIRMWSKQSGDAAGAISPAPEHPHARPVRGAWLVRVDEGPGLGWVMRHRTDLAEPFAYEVYACGLGEDGLRVWVARRDSLNAAVAWVLQHDRELLAFARGLRPDPTQPGASASGEEEHAADADSPARAESPAGAESLAGADSHAEADGPADADAAAPAAGTTASGRSGGGPVSASAGRPRRDR